MFYILNYNFLQFWPFSPIAHSTLLWLNNTMISDTGSNRIYEALAHDSHKPAFRNPFGAVPAGTPVHIKLRTGEANDPHAKLRLWIDGNERIIEGRRASGMTEFTFTPETTGVVWYYFILETPSGTKWFGVKSPSAGGPGALYDYAPPSWQLTVYDGAYRTSPRFRGGLVYQIFPDRFARSARDDASRYAHHLAMKRPLYVHRAWDEPVLYRAIDDKGEYDPCDFYGGDLAGIEEKLPYLKSLGVTCIYLNPVFEAASNHRYNTADYMNVDPILGGEAALASLAAAAKANGMELMLDGVFSHTGDDSVYFDRRGVYSGNGAARTKASPYYNWYEFYAWPESCRCWWGFKTLPEVNENEPSYKKFISGVLAHYAKLGITSWRLDVADELPDDFIAFLRKTLKAIDPDSTLIGEVWEDASNKQGPCGRRKYVDGAELDGVMDYPFRDALVDFLLMRTDAAGLVLRLNALRENYPEPFYLSSLTMLGSHDTVRIYTVLSGAPHRDALTREEQARYVMRPDAAARARARLILAAAVLLSYPGVPEIYYGDEICLEGMADPFNRKTYPWGNEDEHMLSRYRLMCAARARVKAMREGRCGFAAVGGDVFALLRSDTDGSCALTIVNRSEQAKHVSISTKDFTDGPDAGMLFIAKNMTDVLTGASVACADGVINLVLPPLSGALLVNG